MKRALALAATLALPLFGTACGNMNDDISTSDSFALGDALPGTNAADFAEAKAAFNTSENAADGLGPIFNERGCGTCHQNGAIGGAGQQIERRYGTLTNGVFDALANTGGSLRQLFGLGGFNVGGLNCQSGTDANPAPGATIFAGRLTTPLFGLGLVDSLPDSRFDTLAAREPAAIRGIVNRVTIALPNPLDPSQTHRRHPRRPLRLEGGRAQPGAVLGRRLPERDGHHHRRLHPRRVEPRVRDREPRQPRADQRDHQRLPGRRGARHRRRPRRGDQQLRRRRQRAAGRRRHFTFFMAHLAPPPQVAITAGSAAGPRPDAVQLGGLQCASCHRDDADIFVSTSAGGVPAGIVFHPFSDFLVHDMGTLGDGIGNAGDSVAVTRRMRTAPLWGLRSRNKMLHDGRTTDIAHGDLARTTAARTVRGRRRASAFNALSTAQKSDLLAYLNTL